MGKSRWTFWIALATVVLSLFFLTETTVLAQEPTNRDGERIEVVSNVSQVESTTTVTYDREKAVAYAREHAIDYSEDFRSFEGSGNVGEDCTNFASQVAFAGDLPMTLYQGTEPFWQLTGGAQPGDDIWFYKQRSFLWSDRLARDVWTYTWSNVDNFRRYMESSGNVTVYEYALTDSALKSLSENALPGDFVQFGRTKGDTVREYDATHTAVVISVSADGAGLAYHSANTIDISISEFVDKSQEQGANYTFALLLKVNTEISEPLQCISSARSSSKVDLAADAICKLPDDEWLYDPSDPTPEPNPTPQPGTPVPTSTPTPVYVDYGCSTASGEGAFLYSKKNYAGHCEFVDADTYGKIAFSPQSINLSTDGFTVQLCNDAGSCSEVNHDEIDLSWSSVYGSFTNIEVQSPVTEPGECFDDNWPDGVALYLNLNHGYGECVFVEEGVSNIPFSPKSLAYYYHEDDDMEIQLCVGSDGGSPCDIIALFDDYPHMDLSKHEHYGNYKSAKLGKRKAFVGDLTIKVLGWTTDGTNQFGYEVANVGGIGNIDVVVTLQQDSGAVQLKTLRLTDENVRYAFFDVSPTANCFVYEVDPNNAFFETNETNNWGKHCKDGSHLSTPTPMATSTSTPTPTATPALVDVFVLPNPVTKPTWVDSEAIYTGAIQWFECPGEEVSWCVRWNTYTDGVNGQEPFTMTLFSQQDGIYVGGENGANPKIPAGMWKVWGLTLRRTIAPTPTSTPMPTATSTTIPTPTSIPVPTATSTPTATNTPTVSSTPTPTPISQIEDLSVSDLSVSSCVASFNANASQAVSGIKFHLYGDQTFNKSFQWNLNTGNNFVALRFDGACPVQSAEIVIDPDNQIVEDDEGNNSLWVSLVTTPTATPTLTATPTVTPTLADAFVLPNPVTKPAWVDSEAIYTGAIQWFECPGEEVSWCVRWNTYTDGVDGQAPVLMTLFSQQDGIYVGGENGANPKIPAGSWEVWGLTLRRITAPTATSTTTPTSTYTPVPSATSTPIATSTHTPVPTATSTPTPTATIVPVVLYRIFLPAVQR